MNREGDSFELLRRANPFPDQQLGGEELDSEAQEVFSAIVTGSRTPSQPFRKRNGLILTAVGAVALGSAVGATFVLERAPTEPLSVACYAAADLGADTAVQAADVRDPIEVCRDAWHGGAFGTTNMPPLAACILPAGGVGVFPGDQSICDRLRLARFRPEGEPSELTTGVPDQAGSGDTGTAADAVALRDSLAAKIAPSRCVPPREGQALAEAELRVRGLSGWRVEVDSSSFDPGQPCASVAVDVQNHLVILVGLPPG